jgi:hypothetical protein
MKLFDEMKPPRDHSKIVAAVPLIGVNAIAIYGQYGYLHDHLAWPSISIWGFAVTIESIAVYLAYMAHKSLIALDTSMRLRLGAYLFGILAGLMNFSHYSPGFHPTVAGIGTGLLSASSPWLWGVYSRRQSRDILADKGLIEPGAVRLGNRWLVHPIWCVPVYRYAVWNGIRNPTDAINRYDESKPEPEIVEAIPVTEDIKIDTVADTEDVSETYDIGPEISKSAAVRMAFDALGIDTRSPDVVAWLKNRNVTVKQDFVRSIRSMSKRKAVKDKRSNIRAIAGSDTNTKGNETLENTQESGHKTDA